MKENLNDYIEEAVGQVRDIFCPGEEQIERFRDSFCHITVDKVLKGSVTAIFYQDTRDSLCVSFSSEGREVSDDIKEALMDAGISTVLPSNRRIDSTYLPLTDTVRKDAIDIKNQLQMQEKNFLKVFN